MRIVQLPDDLDDDNCVCLIGVDGPLYCLSFEARDFAWDADSVPERGLDALATMVGHALREAGIEVRCVRYVVPETTSDPDALIGRVHEAVMRGNARQPATIQ
ncbi:hypothetical protein [Cupriavidus metallidurans]|uniref:hypothetical protein n=1 Tax=Cupriavidus metallidurans TaxID=119219 RepID=UPI001647571C|nr:hypothetical protein [Cupriavidus metallidurans]